MLSAAWGGMYINEFIDRGRVKRVYMQGDAPFRMKPEDLDRWYVRQSPATMAPFSSFATYYLATRAGEAGRATTACRALEIQGQPAPGKSSGAAMNEIAKLIGAATRDVGYEWTGLSYQERLSGSQAPGALRRFRSWSCSCALRRFTKAGDPGLR